MLVEPLYCLTMLVSRLRHDPDDETRSLAGRIGDDLAEVVVVRGLELVLDYYLPAGTGFLGEDVSAERTH